MNPQPLLFFPPFRLDPVNEQLWRGKRTVSLKPKTFAVLRHLVEQAGRLVTKDELLDALWADVHVGDAVLKVCLREIRAALGDDAKAPRFIETVHRRGYRFIAPVAASAAPVSSFQFQVPSSETQHSLLSTQHSVLVGRETELAQLHAWLERALSGERQVVFVTGEPGIGKTTVVDSFLHQLTARDDLWAARGQCLEQYGAGEAYLPVLEALGRLCRESGNTEIIEVLRRHASTWLVQMPVLLSATELKTIQRKVAGATKERMLREMAEAVEALTATRALVLLLDDLQWSDYATLDLLSYLARRSQPARVLVIAAYRPVDVIVKEHPLKLVKQDLRLHGRCQELPLELLTEEDVAAYLSARFGEEAMRASARQRLARMIYSRTEGNPLFMVTVVDYLTAENVMRRREGRWEVADTIEHLTMPLNIRQFIEQQVEQLNAETQRLLEAASVVGMTFSTAAVAAGLEVKEEDVEQRCDMLARRGQFLVAKGVSEWPDGTVAARYGFLHALYQEALSDRLTVRRRITLQRRIGERLEAAYGDRVGEVAVELAAHFEEGRDAQRAVQYLQQAGENAIRRSAHHEAVLHLAKAVELLQTLADTPERAQQELTLQLLFGTQLSTIKGFAAPDAARAYTRARALCDQVGQIPQRFMALGGLFTFHLTRAELQTAHELADRLAQFAQGVPLDVFFVWADLCVGIVLHAEGEIVSARQSLEQSITRYDPQTHRFPAVQDPGVLNLSEVAPVLWLLGYPGQALARSEEALVRARETAHSLSLAHALYFAARVRQMRGERRATETLTDELIAFAEEQGFGTHLTGGTILRGWLLTEQGQEGQETALIRQRVTPEQEVGTKLNRSYVLALVAEACRKRRQTDEGLRVLDEALAFVHETGEHWYEAELYRLKGELLLQQVEGAFAA
jgi:DNA-binding winged helix-turn-helix (wHTH) protein/tetratricopeptide (TPR) repeat protein